METIIHWERHQTTSPARTIPRITRFLGYCPWAALQSSGERFRQVRVALGLSQKAAARLLGVDPATVTRWELGERRPRMFELGRLLCDRDGMRSGRLAAHEGRRFVNTAALR